LARSGLALPESHAVDPFADLLTQAHFRVVDRCGHGSGRDRLRWADGSFQPDSPRPARPAQNNSRSECGILQPLCQFGHLKVFDCGGRAPFPRSRTAEGGQRRHPFGNELHEGESNVPRKRSELPLQSNAFGCHSVALCQGWPASRVAALCFRQLSNRSLIFFSTPCSVGS